MPDHCESCQLDACECEPEDPVEAEAREDEHWPKCPKCDCRYDHEPWCPIAAEMLREYMNAGPGDLTVAEARRMK